MSQGAHGSDPARDGRDAALDAWIGSRRTADVPPGFADRVMARTAATPAAFARRERLLRAAAVALAVVAMGARIAATVAVFVTR